MKIKEYNEINIIKGICIIFVIISHSILLPICYLKDYLFYMFIIANAIPIFLILLGLNLSMSISKKLNNKYSLKNIYISHNLFNKLKRFIIPFLIIFIIDIIIGIIFFDLTIEKDFDLKWYNLLNFQIFIKGSGTYFTIIYFQVILFFPLIYYCYKRNEKLTLIICFIINFMNCFIIYFMNFYFSYPFNLLRKIGYSSYIIRYLFLIVLGNYLFKHYEKGNFFIFLKRNKMFIFGVLIGICYLIFYVYFIPFTNIHLLIFIMIFNQIIVSFYCCFICIILIEFLPKINKNLITKFLSYIGKKTYYIFLIQMIYFGFLRGILNTLYITYNSLDLHTIIFILIICFINIVFCLLLGILFFKLCNFILEKLKNKM